MSDDLLQRFRDEFNRLEAETRRQGRLPTLLIYDGLLYLRDKRGNVTVTELTDAADPVQENQPTEAAPMPGRVRREVRRLPRS